MLSELHKTTEPLPFDFQLELQSSIRQVFRRHGLELTPTTQVTDRNRKRPGGAVLGSIGFHGRSLAGSLILIAPTTLLKRTYPVPAHDPSPEELADWTGELANRVLGQLKSQSLGHGVSFDLGIPLVMLGSHFRIAATHEVNGRTLVFNCDDAEIDVCFDLAVRTPEPDGESEEVTAASTIIFLHDDAE